MMNRQFFEEEENQIFFLIKRQNISLWGGEDVNNAGEGSKSPSEV